MVASALNVGRWRRRRPAGRPELRHQGRPAGVHGRAPAVLFDEAHHNFHTAGGRYKPFAELIANDGYKVIPNKEKFTKELLAKGDILIIANALGAAGMGQPGAANSAFTDAECDAVRDWVQAGGSLLLITDHAPFGSAAESLAKRFGVDMSKGYTSDPSNSEGGETSLVFTRKNNLLGDHPITTGRDDSERINRDPDLHRPVAQGAGGERRDPQARPTRRSTSGDDGKPISAAGRAQGVAFAFGKGRVVVLGEAAELSAQVVGTAAVRDERAGPRQPPDGPQHHALALRPAGASRRAAKEGGVEQGQRWKTGRSRVAWRRGGSRPTRQRRHFPPSDLPPLLFQTAVRSSEARERMPLSLRMSSVAARASLWSKTMVSEPLSSKLIVVNFSFVSRKTSTKCRRFLIRTPLTSLTTLKSGFEYPLPILCGNIGAATITSSSPGNLGWSPRRVAIGLPIKLRSEKNRSPARRRATRRSAARTRAGRTRSTTDTGRGATRSASPASS